LLGYPGWVSAWNRPTPGRARNADDASAPRPRLPRDREREPWAGACRQGTLAGPDVPCGAWTALAPGGERRRSIGCGPAAEQREGHARQGQARDGARVAWPPHHREQRMQKRPLPCTRCRMADSSPALPSPGKWREGGRRPGRGGGGAAPRAALGLARPGSPPRPGVSVGLWPAAGDGLPRTTSALSAVWSHTVLPRRRGGTSGLLPQSRITLGKRLRQQSQARPSIYGPG